MDDHLDLLDTTPERLSGYKVHKHLGSGATADVFLVVDKTNSREYVLKQMPLANMTDEEKLRAKQEILVMDGVDHPNVVKFHESFSSNSSVDIVMECCEGGTLEQLIDRQRHEGKPFPEDVLIEWMAELLCALSHIHSKRILHRDLKTSNIFATAKNHLKLGDFGVCTILSNANAKAESMIGTPLYFAPEVCENEAYDERSDVWSLGVVFYEMCTLRRPFEADNLFSLIQRILTQEVAPFNTGLDMAFEAIVRKMLSKDPNDRPTAQELINDHLNVPKSHPSHPSQKPSRSRLVQQYYGPELEYTKTWPPPSEAPALPRSKSEKAPAACPPVPERTRKNGHNDAGDYIVDENDREQYIQLLNQTLGASARASPGPAQPAALEKKNKPKVASASTPAPAATAKATKSTVRMPTTKPAALETSAVQPAASSKLSKSDAGARVTKPPVVGKSVGSPRNSLRANDSLASSQMDEVKMDLVRLQTEMFGESEGFGDYEPVLVEVAGASVVSSAATPHARGSPRFNNSATVRLTSSFLEDVAAVLERHTLSGTKVQLEELDDAAQLLSQYKLSTYGLY